jgi:cytochrome b involved in lipid metabolism
MKTLLGLAVVIVLVGAGWFLFRGMTPEKTMAPTVEQESVSSGSVPSEKKVYAMEEVATYKDATGCLTVIRGTVYDVTAFIDRHPGGDKNILRLCGLDGTAAFEKKHGGQEKPENALKGFEVGTLAQ